MRRLLGAIALFLILPTPSFAQAPPCLIDTPTQRAVWDRMKAENHPGYVQISFNTTWDRYADWGRWELVKGVIDRDPAMLRKSFLELRAYAKDFTTIISGNALREYGTDFLMLYGCVQPHLTADEDAAIRQWFIAVADLILTGTRLGDSDQTTGAYFALAMTDKMLGTNYLSREMVDGVRGAGTRKPVGGLVSTAADCSTMRNCIRHYTETMADGGSWIEAPGGYDVGTTKLLYMGAYWTGIAHFPEVARFLQQQARYLPHFLTPNLKGGGFQSGDNEHPHNLRINVGFGALLSFIAGFGEAADPDTSARIRQLEDDLLVAQAEERKPLFARYYYTYNPYGAKLPWREWAGLSLVTLGQGHAFWRKGDRATWVHFPQFTKGRVDHMQAFSFGDFRHVRAGLFAQNRPIGYSPDAFFGNATLVGARWHPGIESIGLVGSAFISGKVGFATGTISGLSGLHTTSPGYGHMPPFIHEQSSYVFEDLSGQASVIAIIERIHADDPRTQTEGGRTWEQIYSSQLHRDRINAVPKVVERIFHTPVQPTFSDDRATFSWPVGATTTSIQQVWPSAPLTREVIDLKANHWRLGPCTTTRENLCFGGYMSAAEVKYAVKGTRAAHTPGLFVMAHCITAREDEPPVVCERVESTNGEGDPVIGVRVRRDGPDAVFLVSAIPGPRQEGNYVKNQHGSPNTVFDPARKDRVVAARQLSDVRLALDEDADIYLADLGPAGTLTVNGQARTLTRVGDLAAVTVAVDAPPAQPATWKVLEATPDRIILERVP